MLGKTRLRNDLLCVEWDVKPYSLTYTGLLQMERLRAQIQDLDVTVSQQAASHHDQLAHQDKLMCEYKSDIQTLNDKLKRSEQQVTAF